MRKGTAMTKYFFTRHSVGRFGTDDDECSRLSETGRRDDGPVQIPLQKEDVDCTYCRSYMRHTCQESVCPYIPERLEAGTIGYQELAERCLRMAGHQKLWKRASSLFPKGIRFLLRWNRPIGTGCLSGRRPAQPLSAPRSWRRFICSPPASGSGGECFPIYLTAGSTSPPFPCGGSTRGTIRVYRAAKGLYCGKLLITSAELADEEQVSSEAFGDILNAMLIARYGKTIIAAEVKKMRYVLQVVLSNAQHPEYGQATIPSPFPIRTMTAR